PAGHDRAGRTAGIQVEALHQAGLAGRQQRVFGALEPATGDQSAYAAAVERQDPSCLHGVASSLVFAASAAPGFLIPLHERDAEADVGGAVVVVDHALAVAV